MRTAAMLATMLADLQRNVAVLGPCAQKDCAIRSFANHSHGGSALQQQRRGHGRTLFAVRSHRNSVTAPICADSGEHKLGTFRIGLVRRPIWQAIGAPLRRASTRATKGSFDSSFIAEQTREPR